MSKLEVKENKKLVLKQVLIKELKNFQLEKINEEVDKFTNQLRLLNVQTFGPLITKSSGTNIHDDGSITMDVELMVQAHDYKQYKKTFHTKERVEFSHCIYVRYEGKPENMHYANSKLELYLYENDLVTDGSTINVYVDESTDKIVIDIFQPVVRL